jgi:hypothetical protein
MRENGEVSVAPCRGASEKSSVDRPRELVRGCGRDGGGWLKEKFIGAGNAVDGAGVTGRCVGDGDGGVRGGGSTGLGTAIATGGSGGGGGGAGTGKGGNGSGSGGTGTGAGSATLGGEGALGGSTVARGTGMGAGGGVGVEAGAGISSCGLGRAGPSGLPPSNTNATVAGGGNSSSLCRP